MRSAPAHPNEDLRLEALLELEVLDSEGEQCFDDITQLASALCGTEIALVSLVDRERQWFKSKVGLDITETSRDIAFCSHAILQEDVFEIPDAQADERFHDNPFVTQEEGIRFYAGAPLVTKTGMPIGTLCVIDSSIKTLTEQQRFALQVLSKQVISQLELRLKNRYLSRLQSRTEDALAILAHDLRSPFNGILGLARMLKQKANSLAPNKIMEMAELLLGCSVQVYNIMDDLLQWCRFNGKAANLKLSAREIGPIISDALSLFHAEIEKKGITFTNNIPEALKIFCDEALTKAIFRNLISNAIKYTPKNGSISIECDQQENNASMLRITITDSGPGIPLAERDRLFHHSVASAEDESGQSGFGIGLSLCGKFVREQQGKIFVDPDYDQGAKIHIDFKRA